MTGTRVSRSINTPHLLEGSVRIDLRSRETGVPQEGLDGTYVRPVVEHSGSKRMAQDVRRVLLQGRYLSHTRANDNIYIVRIHRGNIAVTALAYEQRGRYAAAYIVGTGIHILLDLRQQSLTYRHDALFAPFTEDTNLPSTFINIHVAQAYQLRTTHTGLVKQLDNQAIADGFEIVRLGVHRSDGTHLGRFEEDRQGLVRLRGDHAARYIFRHYTLLQQKAIETAQA